jgi:hypothetical protein
VAEGATGPGHVAEEVSAFIGADGGVWHGTHAKAKGRQRCLPRGMATAGRAQMGSGGVCGLVWLGQGGLGRAHGLGPSRKG